MIQSSPLRMSASETSYELVTVSKSGMDLAIYRASGPFGGMKATLLQQTPSNTLMQQQGPGQRTSSALRPSKASLQPKMRLPEVSDSPRYASSAPATSSPFVEMEEFSAVSKIAEKVKMNPLARSFSPTLLQAIIRPNYQRPASTQYENMPNSSAMYHNSGSTPMKTGNPHFTSSSSKKGSTQTIRTKKRNKHHSKKHHYFYGTQAEYVQDNDYFENVPNYQAPSAYGSGENVMVLPVNRPNDCISLSSNSYTAPEQYSLSLPMDNLSLTPTTRRTSLWSSPTIYYQDEHQQIEGPFQCYSPIPIYHSPDSVNHVEHCNGNSNPRHTFPRPYNNTPIAICYLEHFTRLFGQSATYLPSLHAIALTLGCHRDKLYELDTIRKAQNWVKSKFVNIFDLVEAGMQGRVVDKKLIWKTPMELRAYSERERKVCPSEVGRGEGRGTEGEGNELWRWMLRKWY
jgi:hypothetical protein